MYSRQGATQIHVYLYLTFASSHCSTAELSIRRISPLYSLHFYSLRQIHLASQLDLSTPTWKMFGFVYCLYSITLVLVVVVVVGEGNNVHVIGDRCRYQSADTK